jgi:dynactin complex subunit
MGDQNGASRMDRVERMMEMLITDHVKFSDEHKQLLTAQVVLTDRMDRLTTTMQQLAEAQKRTDQQMKESDERLGILTRMMDEFIRRDRSKSP